jgi:Mor family transcriptional regulator
VSHAKHEARYPTVLADLADHVTRQLQDAGIDRDRATAIGASAAEHVREVHGGQLVYFPKGAGFSARKRWDEIWAAFDGRNHAELAYRFGMGVQGIYRVLAIKREEARQQPGLFWNDGGAA